MDYSDMTTTELRDGAARMLAEVERREAEEAARRAVDEAVINAVAWSPLAYPQAWKEVR